MTVVPDLIQWYCAEKRALPWRSTKNPYLIWISEIILQQIRVNQGLEYYLRFEGAFPDLIALSKTSENEIL